MESAAAIIRPLADALASLESGGPEPIGNVD
jgi:hypothetical protein